MVARYDVMPTPRGFVVLDLVTKKAVSGRNRRWSIGDARREAERMNREAGRR